MRASESDIESSIVLQLAGLGWRADPTKSERNVYRQTPKTPQERERLERARPDFILYADNDSSRPTLIIEAKKPNTPLESALEQCVNYARLLGAPIALATDGYRLKSWHLPAQAALYLNGREVDGLFSADLARRFAGSNVLSSLAGRSSGATQGELIKQFKQANDVLRHEGLEAGVVRFSEFAKLMFLKLKLEDGGDICGITWDDIVRKTGKAQLAAVKTMLSHLHKAQSELFVQTKISQPANMGKLVDILSQIDLSGTSGDVKGMAFEYFIHSYTQGMKNDLGQYFTPRHVIKAMVAYLKPCLGETVYDPFCGTGGMLIEAFRYIQNTVSAHDSSDSRRLREETLFGRDISGAARIAMMNMIMFGDGHSNVEQGDSYSRFDCHGKHDVVITNIPFSQTTGHTEGYPVAPAGKSNGDSIGVQHCLLSMKNSASARAAIIVPIGFVYKDQLRGEREYLCSHFHLDQVVELTPKCFNPYTEQQTAILMVRRRARMAGKTVYYKVKNDGFSQDGYRVPLPGGNDLDQVMENAGGEPIAITGADGWKYKKIALPARAGHAPLREFATIRKGDSISPKTMLKYTTGGTRPIVMVADLAALHTDYCLDDCGAKINETAVREKKPFLFPRHAIVIPSSGKAALLNHRALLDAPAYLSATVTGIVAKDGIHPFYLFYWLLRWDSEDATYDLGYPGLSSQVIGDILIPRLSSEEQSRIVASVGQAAELQKQFKASHRKILLR